MIVDFPAIEAMQEASEAAGWQCEYRQLDAGRLVARTVLRDCDDLSFLRESASRRLSIVAESPADAVTIIVPASNSLLRINGIDVISNTVVIIPAGTDLHALSDPGADALSIHVPADRFDDFVSAAVGPQHASGSSGAKAFQASAETLRGLRNMIRACTAEDRAAPASNHNEVVAGRLIVDLLRDGATVNPRKTSLREARARRVIIKTLEYIDENLSSQIRVADLCCAAGVSLSTLERVFQHELQMTPLAYIRARRLDAIRRTLVRGDSDTPIAQLAHDHGISHLGRFAADYRRQFGVLPSEQRLN
jgi:AraC family ethanolamine operon transcriptional activator